MSEPADGKRTRVDWEDDIDPVRLISTVVSEVHGKLRSLTNGKSTKPLLLFGEMETWTAVALSKVLRRMGKVNKITLVLESDGGDLDIAIKLYKMLRAHCTHLTTVVPFWAKSAASLVALSSDEILLTPYGELGPIDAQVEDPDTHAYVPAHSIGRALDFIEGTTDDWVKVSLALKLSPLLIGGYLSAVSAGEQEVKEVCTRLGLKDSESAVETLTSKYLSHGYPVTADDLKDHRFPIRRLGLAQSRPYMELHDSYVNLRQIHEHDTSGCVYPVLAQCRDFHVAMMGKRVISESSKTVAQGKNPEDPTN